MMMMGLLKVKHQTRSVYKGRCPQVFLVKENLSVCTGPLVKFSLVKSHLLESWRASFLTSLTSENLVCVHTSESRREELVKENLPVHTGLTSC